MSKILAYHFHAVDYVFSQEHEMEICEDPLLILPSTYQIIIKCPNFIRTEDRHQIT